jgi:hypothetical protein
VPEFHRLNRLSCEKRVADYHRRFGFSPTPEHVLSLYEGIQRFYEPAIPTTMCVTTTGRVAGPVASPGSARPPACGVLVGRPDLPPAASSWVGPTSRLRPTPESSSFGTRTAARGGLRRRESPELAPSFGPNEPQEGVPMAGGPPLPRLGGYRCVVHSHPRLALRESASWESCTSGQPFCLRSGVHDRAP